MNPFELHGPAFLGFYLVFAGAVLAGLVLLRRRLGRDGPAMRGLADPYDIALLRDGPVEAVRVAALALLDRQALVQEGGRLQAAAGGSASDELESAILRCCSTPLAPHRIPQQAAVRAALATRSGRLEGLGLAPDEATRWQHLGLAAAAVVLLAGVALGKVVYAVANGHSNVEFLIILGGLATVIAVMVGKRVPSATPQGRTTLVFLGELFNPLRQQRFAAKPRERAFLAAVYGTAALSGADLLMWRLFNPPPAASGSGSGCGSGSSCGGSGCGGGGCGGCGG